MSTIHDIQIAATLSGSTVRINGNGARRLERGSGAHRFNFRLDDQTGLNVRFSHLDSEDNCSTCPPASGDNSNQIVGVRIGPGPGTASFIDNNNNRGRMDVAYQWHFGCDDPDRQVEPFDPIIENGGTL